MTDRPTIEQLEAILAGTGEDLTVEVLPNGEVHAYKKDEPREQGPVRVMTAGEVFPNHY